MINVLILLTFLIFTTLLFYIENIYILLFFLLINFIIDLFKKISIFEILNYNKNIFLFFILIIALINILLMTSLKETIIISIRLLLACNLTFTLRYFLPSYNLIKALEIIFIPLKIFKINTEKISIILNIGINFIPIFLQEFDKINASLAAKGVKNSILLKFKYVSKLLLPTIFKKTRELDYSLKSKNYT